MRKWTYKAIRDPNRCPSHPGAVIADILLDYPHVTKTDVAARLDISRNQLHAILAERKPVTAHMAVRIAAVFGGKPESYLRMQAAHDAWHAEREVDVSKLRPLSRRS